MYCQRTCVSGCTVWVYCLGVSGSRCTEQVCLAEQVCMGVLNRCIWVYRTCVSGPYETAEQWFRLFVGGNETAYKC